MGGDVTGAGEGAAGAAGAVATGADAATGDDATGFVALDCSGCVAAAGFAGAGGVVTGAGFEGVNEGALAAAAATALFKAIAPASDRVAPPDAEGAAGVVLALTLADGGEAV